MAKGNLKKRVSNINSEDELGKLAHSVNRLGEWVESLEDLRMQMTSDIAHELRTPLSVVQSHIEAILDGVWEPTPERIRVCYDEIVRLSSMVKDIEKLSSYEKGAVQLEISEFDFGEMIEEVKDYFRLMFEDKGVELRISTGDNLKYRGDRYKIKQVMINLLSNALKFTDRGGTVGLKALNGGDELVIIVEDTGRGISKKDLPFIFERFYRADKSRNRATGGSGIGLSITKAIVELHGGRIEVQSEEGKGSKFEVHLPYK
jgi:signal transduction histidine kinase